MDLIIQQLNSASHDRDSFDCEVEELNIFLKYYAKQNQTRNISTTYVAVNDLEKKKIYGYYTLSAGNIQSEYLPENIKSKLPKYPIPIARVGRLAVDRQYKLQGVCGFLLYSALSNVLNISTKLGIFAVVVDAKNLNVKSFYQKYGFLELLESENGSREPVAGR